MTWLVLKNPSSVGKEDVRHGEDIINGKQGGMCDMVKTSSTVSKEDVRHGEDIINSRQGGMCDMVKT